MTRVALQKGDSLSIVAMPSPYLPGELDFHHEKPVAACDDFDRLAMAQDMLIEELQGNVVVAHMVSQAVLRGVLRAVDEEMSALVARKDSEMETAIQEKDRSVEDRFSQLNTLVSQYFDKMKQQELCLLERERDLSRMAENLVDLTFRLNAESLNNSSLEKKLKEVQARDARKMQQISALNEELEKIKVQRSEAAEAKDVVKEKKQAREAGSLQQITDLTDELVKIKMEQSSETEMLRKECQVKERRYREELEELAAENERKMAALRADNSEKQAMIMSLAEKQAELAAAHRVEIGRKLREKELQHEHDLRVLREEMEVEGDVLEAYLSSFVVSIEEKYRKIESLEADVLFECFVGFAEDVKHASAMRSSNDRWKNAMDERLIEQHQQHQLEMDTLLDFFVSKLTEHIRLAEVKSESDVDAEDEVARLQRDVSALRREKDEIIADKTEEMFRMKRDFFKELDKLKLDGGGGGGQSEYGVLKRCFTDARQKVSSLLDRAQSESASAQRYAADDNSDADSVTSNNAEESSSAAPPVFEKFTPELVSELQNDIDQLILDTRMAKAEDSQKMNANVDEVKNELETLAMEYESVCKELDEERRQNYALTMEMQQLEHNISLSNGELEKLHGQLEEEKKANISKETEMDNLRHDLGLLRTQLEALQVHKRSLEGHLQRQHLELELSNERVGALEMELSNLLKLKASISGDRDRLSEEVAKLKREAGTFSDICDRLDVGLKDQTAKMEEYSATTLNAIGHEQARLGELVALVEDLNQRWMVKKSDFKRRLGWYHRNLRKAEDEVDLLGDENEYLLNLLEKLYLAIKNYEPVLQHYPQISELSKLIKTELMKRIAGSSETSCTYPC